MYLQGFTQVAIAEKIKVNQATVSLYVNEFTIMVDEEGLEAAAKEYGLMDVVKELHSLGAELKKSDLTAEDAKKALKVVVVLEECGVPQDGYKNVINTCIKMHNEGFLSAAMELHKIEESSGKSFKEIMEEASNAQTQIQQAKKELSATQEKIGIEKQTLAALLQQKAGVGKDLQQLMQKVGVDFERFGKIENLAMALKKADVTDKELDSYIQRQNLLNKAGISIDTFTQILDAAKVPTASDGGKGFLKKLIEYGSLEGTVTSLEQQEQGLTLNVSDLKAKAKLKGKLEAETLELETRKAALEITVSQLDAQKQKTANEVQAFQAERESIAQQILDLKYDISEKQKLDASLDDAIHTKQKHVADLAPLELKRNALSSEVTGLEARAVKEKRRLDVSDAVMALVQSVPLAGLEALQEHFPKLLEEARVGQSYSPKVLRDHMLRELTGGTVQVLRCLSCGMQFTVNKPANSGGYHCPNCLYSSQVEVDKNETEIIKAALAESKRGTVEITMITPPKNYPPK